MSKTFFVLLKNKKKDKIKRNETKKMKQEETNANSLET